MTTTIVNLLILIPMVLYGLYKITILSKDTKSNNFSHKTH